MATVVSMSFRIIEPMMFRGPGEFDPFVRGTYSSATTLAMPSPSTVAGTLATYCISKLGRTVSTSQDWVDQYLSVLGSDINVRGPLIKLNHELMAEDGLSRGFLTMEKIRQKCETEWKRLNQKPDSLKELEEYLKREEFKPSVKLEKDARIGVMLEMRGNTPIKRAKEGHLYSAEYIDYARVRGKMTEETSVEILAEIRGNLAKGLSSAQELPVKFGGEGRVAFLSFRQGEGLLDKIKERLWDGKERHYGSLALYLATPALFKGGKRVEEYVKEWAGNMNYRFLGISGESAVLGAGFSIQHRKRKPIYSSLKPGSIIFLEGYFDLDDIYLDNYQKRPLSEAKALGYGTIIPVPLKNKEG